MTNQLNTQWASLRALKEVLNERLTDFQLAFQRTLQMPSDKCPYCGGKKVATKIAKRIGRTKKTLKEISNFQSIISSKLWGKVKIRG